MATVNGIWREKNDFAECLFATFDINEAEDFFNSFEKSEYDEANDVCISLLEYEYESSSEENVLLELKNNGILSEKIEFTDNLLKCK